MGRTAAVYNADLCDTQIVPSYIGAKIEEEALVTSSKHLASRSSFTDAGRAGPRANHWLELDEIRLLTATHCQYQQDVYKAHAGNRYQCRVAQLTLT